MKIVCISDTHNKLSRVDIPDGDILVHTGDATYNGNIREVSKFNNDLGKLKHPIKIFVPGNHDILFQQQESIARSIMTNANVLIDEFMAVNGIKIYGSPWQPWFYDWAFNFKEDDDSQAINTWSMIPDNIDILLTHGPPFGIRDTAHRLLSLGEDSRVGCPHLLRRVKEVRPKFHIFGHIHEDYGISFHDNIHFINASSCSLEYSIANKPIVIEL